ncbi:hypothetical protein N7540_006498 [Penicillium herquei]|nr:hypothetical protein N7540_006498 [Penicillium herquei]
MTEFIPSPPSAAKTGSFPPTESVPVAPPPWTLKAKAWTFLYSDVDQESEYLPQNPNNAPDILQDVLPLGSYHPLESLHSEALQKLPGGKPQYRRGWLKGITIIRYEDSDVGPYDELILVPGKAVNPHTGKADMRITTIFVSTDASVWNGRRNWSSSPFPAPAPAPPRCPHMQCP